MKDAKSLRNQSKSQNSGTDFHKEKIMYTKRAVGSMRSFHLIRRWRRASGEFKALKAGNDDRVVFMNDWRS